MGGCARGGGCHEFVWCELSLYECVIGWDYVKCIPSSIVILIINYYIEEKMYNHV